MIVNTTNYLSICGAGKVELSDSVHIAQAKYTLPDVFGLQNKILLYPGRVMHWSVKVYLTRSILAIVTPSILLS